MERIARNRKGFDQKQNDFKHLNKKPAMLASMNFKGSQFDNPKIIPNLHNVLHNYQSYNPSYNERPSLTLDYRKAQIQQRKSLPPQAIPQEISNSKAYCKVYQKDLSKYLEQCLSQQGTESFLSGHQITSSLRARMLDWMVQVIESYKFSSKTFFAGIQIMDSYFAKQRMAIPVQKLHIIGVVSMLIASKMEEVYPFRLRTIYEKIVHKKIPIQEIVEMQGVVFSTLDFQTVTATFFDKIMLQLHAFALQKQYPQNVSFENFGNNPLKKEQVLQEVANYCSLISKLLCYNYDLMISFQKQTIADAVISLVFEILDLKIPGVSKSSFNINSKECQQAIEVSLSKYKKSFKGLNNIFKFSDTSIIKKLQEYFDMNDERKEQ